SIRMTSRPARVRSAAVQLPFAPVPSTAMALLIVPPYCHASRLPSRLEKEGAAPPFDDALHHDEFGLNQPEFAAVIDSNSRHHDVTRKLLRIFRHHALTARQHRLKGSP